MRDAMRRKGRTIFFAGAIALAALVVLGIGMETAGRQTNLAGVPERDGAGRALEVFELEALGEGDSLTILATSYDSRTPFALYIVECDGLAKLRAGDEPASTLARTTSTYSAELELLWDYGQKGCPLAGVVRWPGSEAPEDGDAQAYVYHDPAQTPFGRLVPWLALVAGGLMTLGIAMGHDLFRAARSEPVADDATSVELGLLMARKGELWLERTRRYLLLMGLAGFVPLYALVLFALATAIRGVDAAEPLRWLALAGAALLAAATAAWWRRLREADLELRAWREHVARLRAIEDDILAG